MNDSTKGPAEIPRVKPMRLRTRLREHLSWRERLFDWARGSVMPWRCVWAGHKWRSNRLDEDYAYRCTRARCSHRMTPAEMLW